MAERRGGAGRRLVAAGNGGRAWPVGCRPWPYVIGLFLGAKLLLTVVGLLVLHAWDGIPGAPPPDDALMWAQQRELSGHRWISLWFAWDALLYLRLSELP
ncbi:hypothetical protein NKG94_11510 [Micromonospora sp. M12]